MLQKNENWKKGFMGVGPHLTKPPKIETDHFLQLNTV